MMKKIIEYRYAIVCSLGGMRALEDLAAQINTLINQGWQPVGELFKSSDPISKEIFVQAMALYEDDSSQNKKRSNTQS